MDPSLLARRNLSHYWRTNIAVVLGVAAAVAVLSGALLVGDSVRGSLRDLVAQRLGRTDFVVTTMLFFREALAKEVPASTPLIALEGVAVHDSDKRSTSAQVYGVDDRFWKFQNVVPDESANREAQISSALASVLCLFPRPADAFDVVSGAGGHSVGEIAALAGTNVISAESALVLVRERGDWQLWKSKEADPPVIVK